MGIGDWAQSPKLWLKLKVSTIKFNSINLSIKVFKISSINPSSILVIKISILPQNLFPLQYVPQTSILIIF